MTESSPPGPPNDGSGNSPSDGDEHLNTDGRAKGEWKSIYDPEAISHIRVDAIFVGVVLLITLTALILTWKGFLYDTVAFGCSTCSRATLDKYTYFFLGGLLGGTLFGIKYLYRSVARGFWNMDRRLWRIFSPLSAGGLALAVGTLIDSGIFGVTIKTPGMSSYFSIGFLTGYFADSALAKMQEIAYTIFGSPDKSKHPPAKKTVK